MTLERRRCKLIPDDDFPQFAQAAALVVSDSKDPRAILICGGSKEDGMAANHSKNSS